MFSNGLVFERFAEFSLYSGLVRVVCSWLSGPLVSFERLAPGSQFFVSFARFAPLFGDSLLLLNFSNVFFRAFCSDSLVSFERFASCFLKFSSLFRAVWSFHLILSSLALGLLFVLKLSSFPQAVCSYFSAGPCALVTHRLFVSLSLYYFVPSALDPQTRGAKKKLVRPVRYFFPA